eukprot:9759205-Alexandrium_andersonii.AAC.1
MWQEQSTVRPAGAGPGKADNSRSPAPTAATLHAALTSQPGVPRPAQPQAKCETKGFARRTRE